MHSVAFPEALFIAVMALALGAAIVIPAMRILRRIGYPPWMALAAIIPLLNVALLWFVAFTRWPRAERAS